MNIKKIQAILAALQDCYSKAKVAYDTDNFEHGLNEATINQSLILFSSYLEEMGKNPKNNHLVGQHKMWLSVAYDNRTQIKPVLDNIELMIKTVDIDISSHPTPIPKNEGAVEILNKISSRLTLMINSLDERVYDKKRHLLEITDEWDLLYYLQGLLLLFFDGVKPEQYTPSYGKKSSKIDYFLTEEKIAIEVKYLHENYSEKDIRLQLDIDYRHYTGVANTELVYAMVYDPFRIIKQPLLFIKDLERDRSGDKPMKVYVIQ